MIGIRTFFCDNCNLCFGEEDAGIHREPHYEVAEMGYVPEETWLCCPNCRCDELTEANECEVCGKPTKSNYCDECRKTVNSIIDEVEERVKSMGYIECFKDLLVERYF